MVSSDLLPSVFVELADPLTDDFDVVRHLQVLVGHATQLSGAAAVGVLLDGDQGRLHLAAASEDSVRALGQVELQAGDGPGLDCFRTREPVAEAHLAGAVERWPAFVPAALAAGFGSVHAVPMRLRDTAIGALGLLGAGDAFGAREQAVVQALADVATIAVISARTLELSRVRTAQLQHALDSRVVLEQAKGVVAARESISPDEAFDRLRAHARSSRRTLAEVSAAVVDPLRG